MSDAGDIRADQARVVFLLEESLGHVTHAASLRAHMPAVADFEPAFISISYPPVRTRDRFPPWSNWTVRSGLQARAALRGQRGRRIDALFVHTFVLATLNVDVLRRWPSIVSLDATPVQFDELGESYGHTPHRRLVERVKRTLNRQTFTRADRLVAWTEWAKASLVDDYGVDADRVEVIPPGVDRDRWGVDRSHRRPGPTRVLFVGGDLARKGGLDLIAAIRGLRADGVQVELDLVTRDAAQSEPGIRVHNGLSPNDPELVGLFRDADVFCLATYGDCLPIALMEAGASGLALVSSDVGAIREIVRPEESGLLVTPGDAAALRAALRRLVDDDELRRGLGRGAEQIVAREFDARTNAARLAGFVSEVVASRREQAGQS